MTNKKELIKSIIKLDETALLNRYLKSRGINPGFVSKDQKVAHSKTNQFKVWMRAHVNDPVTETVVTEPSPSQKRLKVLKTSISKHKEVRVPDGQKQLHAEAVDKKDTITFDIPLLIRVLEFAREELKSDINLHKMVERLISIRGKGTLTMNQYGRIVKEEIESDRLDEISAELQHRYFKARYAQHPERKGTPKKVRQGMDKVINRALKRNTISTPGAEKDFKDQETKRGVGNVRDHVEVDGTVVEGKEANYGGGYQASVLAVKAKAEKKPVDMKSLAARMQASYAKDKVKKESLEPMAACNCTSDGANNPDDIVPSRSSKLKMLLDRKKTVKEEMYDHEKEDKPVTTPGKKVKLEKPGVDSVTKETPQAAAILTGGKTMTGEPRDTIEIDPMMKMRKQSSTGPQKNG